MDRFSSVRAFDVPEQKRIRLIINSDAKNEADDQFAITHAVLTPKFDVRGMIGAHFGDEKSAASMSDSCDEIEKIMDLMGMKGRFPILRGAPRALGNAGEAVDSEGSDFIVREALRRDPRPLFCAFLGPLTDMASAVLRDPRIIGNVTVVWIGGGAWPEGGEEYNLRNDVRAANVVLESGVELWQIPRDVYSMMRVSLAELCVRVRPCSAIGKYLFDQMLEVNERYADTKEWPAGESWVLGDSAAVGVLLDDQPYHCSTRSAPKIDGRMHYVHGTGHGKMRVYHTVDARFIVEDFYSKLALFGQGKDRPG
jgi:purine nucleosidase